MATPKTLRTKYWRTARHAMLVPSLLAGLVAMSAGCTPDAPTRDARPATATSRARLVGKNGPRTISTAATVVNQYTTLAQNVAAAATSLTLSSVAALTDGANALAPGDLLLVVQMQGATVDTTATNATYGQVTSLGSAGNYEFIEVSAVNATANTVSLSCALKHAYTVAGKTQVIRVPQYTTLTIAASGSITAPPWNGTTGTGGVVAVHALETITVNGTINASAIGFQGGVADDLSGDNATNVTLYSSTLATDGGRKGEGIAGFAAVYGRGAMANGGGGGNSHNAGGGGGANGRHGAAWTGQGVFDLTVTGGALAWPRDPNYPVGGTASEGGGRGGYTYSNSDQNATVTGPDDASWSGNQRRQRGGLGGRPVDNDPTGRLFLGGGGGAGDGNNAHAGRGGNGGGLVLLVSPQVGGTGRIQANGENGADADSRTGAAEGDAPGGGGGGGTVVIQSTTLTGVTIEAKGGAGGIQYISSTEAEGPGGGGGGGYVALTAAYASIDVGGGVAGTTSSLALTEFPANGATRGGDGEIKADMAQAAVPICLDTTAPDTAIDSAPARATPNATATFVFSSPNDPAATFECKIDTGAYVACTKNYSTGPLAVGSHTLYVRAKDAIGNVDPDPADYAWVIDQTAPDVTIATRPANPSNLTEGSFTFTSNESPVTYECKVDAGGPYSACNASFTTNKLSDDSHTILVRAVDAAGNVGTPATYTWLIDTKAPETTISSGPSKVTNEPRGTFQFTSNDPTATFECSLDGSAFAACVAPHTTTTLGDGKHQLDVRAVDQAGNADLTPETYTWTIDGAPPDTTISSGPASPTKSTTAEFTFTSNEASVTFECKLDGAADYAACPATYSLSNVSEGSHTMLVRAKDSTNNVDPDPASYKWIVDLTAPTTVLGDRPPAIDTSSAGTFTFSSNDPTATFECKLDALAWAPCNTGYPFVLPAGPHTFVVRARDVVGNLDPNPPSYTWTIQAQVVLDAGDDANGGSDAGADADADDGGALLDADGAAEGAADADGALADANADAPTDAPSDAMADGNADGALDGALDAREGGDGQADTGDGGIGGAGGAGGGGATGGMGGAGTGGAGTGETGGMGIAGDTGQAGTAQPATGLVVLGGGIDCSVSTPGRGQARSALLFGAALALLLGRRRKNAP